MFNHSTHYSPLTLIYKILIFNSQYLQNISEKTYGKLFFFLRLQLVFLVINVVFLKCL